MHHFETMFKDKGLIMDEKARKVCTRYCGGSHTIITPQDRIERGRCGKVFGARTTTAKCICTEPEPSPCTCPDDPEEPECVCPIMPEVCSCSSESNPFENCMTAADKRCIEIDRNRNKFKDQQNQTCEDEADERGKIREEERKKRDKCRMEIECRDKCLQKLQLRDKCITKLDRHQEYAGELYKLNKCKMLAQRNKKGSQTERSCSRRNTSSFTAKETYSKQSLPNKIENQKLTSVRSNISRVNFKRGTVHEKDLTLEAPFPSPVSDQGSVKDMTGNEIQSEPQDQLELELEELELQPQQQEEFEPELELQSKSMAELTENPPEQTQVEAAEETADQNMEEQNEEEENQQNIEEGAPDEG